MALPELIKDLLASGVHFGHLSKHWNPKMKKFIYGRKKNIYIIDLMKTADKLEEAKQFLKEVAQNGGKILFVGTKRHIRSSIKEMAQQCQMPYIVERWVGGLLTNFSTIERRVKRYIEIKEQKEKGEFARLPSKEVARLNKELERMDKIYSGVISLGGLPQCMFIVDPKKEHASVHEANKLSIPIVALIDTDANPDLIDYPVPGNDDAIKSVRAIVSHFVEAINEGLEETTQVEGKPKENASQGGEERSEGTSSGDTQESSLEKERTSPQVKEDKKSDTENKSS